MIKNIFFFCLFLFSPILYADQLIIEPDDGRAPILSAIQQAKQSIELVDYGLTDETIINALIQAKKSGKNVDVLLECAPYKNENENIVAINQLHTANIKIICGNPLFKFTHQKTFIFDHTTAIIMTFNLTRSTFKNERNFAIHISDPKIIDEIDTIFHADISRNVNAVSEASLFWSPNNSREKIISELNSAQKSIQIDAENISDNEIIKKLAALSRRGILIEILHSHINMHNKKIRLLRHTGVQFKKSKHQIIHAKVILIDHQRAILGSINLTKNSLNNNRELAILITDPDIIQQLSDTFEKDWEGYRTRSQRRKRLEPIKMFFKTREARFNVFFSGAYQQEG